MKRFFKYVSARFDEYQRDLVYRYAVLETTQGKKLAKDYLQIVHPDPIDNRSGDEIAEAIISGAGLTFKERKEKKS